MGRVAYWQTKGTSKHFKKSKPKSRSKMKKPRLGLNQKRLISIETLGVLGNNEKRKWILGKTLKKDPKIHLDILLTSWRVFLHSAHIYLGHLRKKKANEEELKGMLKTFWRVVETHKKGRANMQTK